MSVSTEINRLKTAKSNIKNSIEEKGITVPNAEKITNYYQYIDQLPSLEEYLEMQEKLKNIIYLV